VSGLGIGQHIKDSVRANHQDHILLAALPQAARSRCSGRPRCQTVCPRPLRGFADGPSAPASFRAQLPRAISRRPCLRSILQHLTASITVSGPLWAPAQGVTQSAAHGQAGRLALEPMPEPAASRASAPGHRFRHLRTRTCLAVYRCLIIICICMHNCRAHHRTGFCLETLGKYTGQGPCSTDARHT